MSKVNDPFEEYLRKKKVELLESKFREQASETTEVADEADDFVPPSNDDPELEARVKEEVVEFFDASKDAGAKLFSKAGEGLGEEKVEEIRDALEDVFEEDASLPQTEEEDQHSFVDFFRQVNNEFDDAGAPVVAPDAAVPGAAEPEPVTEDLSDLAATANEVSTDDLIAVEVTPDPPEPKEPRLSLNDMLAPPTTEDELRQRVELLGRIVAKLVDRVKLPENEIIEVLIRSGVEF